MSTVGTLNVFVDQNVHEVGIIPNKLTDFIVSEGAADGTSSWKLSEPVRAASPTNLKIVPYLANY
jgi:hypothetical protein